MGLVVNVHHQSVLKGVDKFNGQMEPDLLVLFMLTRNPTVG